MNRAGDVLTLLAKGPLRRSEIAQVCGYHGKSSQLLRILTALEQAKQVRRLGGGNVTRWALKDYVVPGGAHDLARNCGWAVPFGKAAQPLHANGKVSWWAQHADPSAPRHGFVQAAADRHAQMGGSLAWSSRHAGSVAKGTDRPLVDDRVSEELA